MEFLENYRSNWKTIFSSPLKSLVWSSQLPTKRIKS